MTALDIDLVMTQEMRRWLGFKRRAKFDRMRAQSRQHNVVLHDLRLIYRAKVRKGEL